MRDSGAPHVAAVTPLVIVGLTLWMLTAREAVVGIAMDDVVRLRPRALDVLSNKKRVQACGLRVDKSI